MRRMGTNVGRLRKHAFFPKGWKFDRKAHFQG